MNARFKIALVSIIILQIVSLVVFVIYQENLKDMGTKIVLQTIPIDPRDLLRGEYVDLRYEISDLTVENMNCYRLCLGYDLGDSSNRSRSRKDFLSSAQGENIYILLTKEPYRLSTQAISSGSSWYVYDISESNSFDNRPEEIESVVIKGRIEEIEEIFTEIDYLIRITVDYGIEQYFLEEGKGLIVENADDVKAEVTIASNGKSFITDLIVDGTYLNQSVSD